MPHTSGSRLTVEEIFVAVGERLDERQPMMNIDTDKAVVELQAWNSGTVSELFVRPGEVIVCGQQLLELVVREEPLAEPPL